jgi:hypothetical protein
MIPLSYHTVNSKMFACIFNVNLRPLAKNVKLNYNLHRKMWS